MPESIQPVDIIKAIEDLDGLAREWGQLFPQAHSQADRWQRMLAQIQAHLAEDVVRVAVVGTVKSGKSTLINALVGQDILKRGAGILTAMITRVQPGPEPRDPPHPGAAPRRPSSQAFCPESPAGGRPGVPGSDTGRRAG